MMNQVLIAKLNNIERQLQRDELFINAIEHYIIGNMVMVSKLLKLLLDIVFTIYVIIGLLIRFTYRNQWVLVFLILVMLFTWISDYFQKYFL
ncbi:crescent membrane/immature virion protein [Pteropox virus]|uniref:Crescent membrane/immature virion protein n=1 Tax=Pteropox virus TaxID=1873698 RepID=A0A1B1MRJ9_9POXV|nr:crescent membrane/immature virion protein [Pteropox virus]ANS71150.1 crescent membrane/immature virion protein [Pteropox virus]